MLPRVFAFAEMNLGWDASLIMLSVQYVLFSEAFCFHLLHILWEVLLFYCLFLSFRAERGPAACGTDKGRKLTDW